MRFALLVVTSLFVAACGGDIAPKPPISASNNTSTSPTMDGGSANNAADPDMGPDVVPDATMSSQDAPTIIELGAAPSTLLEGETTLVSAIVTDPQGVEDIVAGRLLDGQTQQLIGNFRSIGGGSFEIDVAWSALDSVRPISFGPNGTQRSLTAEFIDNANERSTRSLSINLSCQGEPACEGRCGEELCNGACANPDFYETPDNCGGCGIACAADEACVNQLCETLPEDNVGGPCVDETDCDSGAICATEAEFGIADGYCALFCQAQADCPGNSECIPFDSGQGVIPICARTCASDSDCRTDFTCDPFDTNEGGVVDVCAPPL